MPQFLTLWLLLQKLWFILTNRGELVVAVYRYRDMFTELPSSPLTAGISNVS